MGLIKSIKEIFRKKQPRIASTDIVGYDTSFIYIPKYKDLTDDEKKIVDRYVSETDTTKFENIIGYGNEVYEYANCNTELLLNLFYQLTDNQTDRRFSERTEQEILEKRLDEMIKQEELQLYKLSLKNLEKEAALRTIALEEIQKIKKKEFRPWGIFEKAERLQRRYQNEQLESAIERMKINKKIIEQQIQSIENTMTNSGTIVQSADVYNVVVTGEDAEEKKQKVLAEKSKELLEMANLVIPGEVEFEETNEDESIKVKQLAKIQRKLEIYAYTHRNNIEKLGEQVKELDRTEKTRENRERLLKEIRDIETKYKIFGRYVQKEDLEGLYKVKFDILTTDINRQKESPLKDILNENELKYYEKIVEEKIEQILQGTNPRLKESFGEEQLREAVKMITKVLKNGQRTFQIENILQDRTLLSLILAFDQEKGMESFSLDKKNVTAELYEDLFGWESQIPVKSIFELREFEEKPITSKDDLYLRLYNMYYDNCKEDECINKLDILGTVNKIPEGITMLSSNDCWTEEHRHGKLLYKLRDSGKIILPHTLKSIGKRVFNYCWYLYDIELNEGLEEIGDNAFCECRSLGEYKTIKLPSTLKKIGNKSFFNCYNLHIMLNEGLKEIGDYAFNFDLLYNYMEFSWGKPQKELHLPSSVEKMGKDISNDKVLKIVKKENRIRALILMKVSDMK